jgi:hypothetical protein
MEFMRWWEEEQARVNGEGGSTGTSGRGGRGGRGGGRGSQPRRVPGRGRGGTQSGGKGDKSVGANTDGLLSNDRINGGHVASGRGKAKGHNTGTQGRGGSSSIGQALPAMGNR